MSAKDSPLDCIADTPTLSTVKVPPTVTAPTKLARPSSSIVSLTVGVPASSASDVAKTIFPGEESASDTASFANSI